jgi:hypothetical protein
VHKEDTIVLVIKACAAGAFFFGIFSRVFRNGGGGLYLFQGTQMGALKNHSKKTSHSLVSLQYRRSRQLLYSKLFAVFFEAK